MLRLLKCDLNAEICACEVPELAACEVPEIAACEVPEHAACEVPELAACEVWWPQLAYVSLNRGGSRWPPPALLKSTSIQFK